MATHRTCDGVTRRDFVKLGAAGAGLNLAGYLRLAAAGQLQPNRAESAIFINLLGGPSHLDTFDMKPHAPREYRGLFQPIRTKVSGVEFCEHLPRLAGCADKFAIVRGVSHTLAAHELGTAYVNTGSRPLAALDYPAYGAVVSRARPSDPELPTHVAIPRAAHGAGFLGVQYSALATANTPRPGQPFRVRGLSLSGELTVADVERRRKLLVELDRKLETVERHSQLLEGLDRFSQQAHQIILSRQAREAFDVSRESPAYAAPFGQTPLGGSCLLASRLVEAGVRFVTVTFGGWDTHADNFGRLQNDLLPALDEGLSALLVGLDQKGLLARTAVFVTGEFGRTPKINDRSQPGGRDHYPRCMFMLLAGGAIRGGQVVGQSDDKAAEPAGEGFTPDDVAATFYHNLGIDHTQEFRSTTGRPITIVRHGRVIPALFA